VSSASELFEKTLLHHSKDRKAVVQAFRKEGLLQPMPTIYAGVSYRTTIIDHLFVESSLNPSSHLCHLITDKHITLVNDAVFPFHVLVAAASACRRVPAFLTSSRAATRAVDFIQSKGFDINAPYPKAFTRRQRRGGKMMAWVQRDPTPIQLLEVYMDKSSPPPRILRDLHGIMVSRGAKTSTGRATQRTVVEPAKQRYYVSQWTTPSTYQHIQDARRREFSTVQGLTSQDKRTNRYLAQVFRNTGTRAPVIPRLDTTNTTLPPPLQNAKATKAVTPTNRPTYLYRGVHGPQGKEYSLHRMFRDKGYIAFSTKKSVANRFTKAEYGMLLRLRVDNVPHGTPWIWFRDPKPQKNKKIKARNKDTFPSTFPEAEVLLPPGTIRLLRRPPSEPDVWDVEYIPDKQATSLDRKPIYRKAAKATNSNNNSATTAWFSKRKR
jgi:hypothetical protein